MKYAIDRFITGLEKEVSADDFDGQIYIPNKLKRFFCPECGLQVYWVSKGGNQPNKFKHPPRTLNSPECDKRVDGRSELYLYERVGLPVLLSHLSGNTFQLAISFPAIGHKMLDTAASLNAKVIIRGKGRSRTMFINPNNFYPDGATLVPVNFLPTENDIFRVDVTPASLSNRKWSDYAEGFSRAGAIFTYDEAGGKKIHRGDSIAPDRQYYVVSRQFWCPYSEVDYKTVGILQMQNITYQVYCMVIHVSLQNELRFAEISNFFRDRFGIGLLEIPPEIIPIWPPVIEQDVLTPTKDSKIFCAISSGNDEPSVYSYVGNQVWNIPVQKDRNGEKHICVNAGATDTVLSVDRKYVGREIIFRTKEIVPSRSRYEYSFNNAEGNPIQYEDLTASVFSNGGSIVSNAKAELYLGSGDHNYLHVPLRTVETPLPTFQNLREVLVLVEGATIVSHATKETPSNCEDNTLLLESIINQCHGEYIPVPRWVYHTINLLKRNGSTTVVQEVAALIVNGKLPIGIIKALAKIQK